ncbi:MAG: pyridoxamine 5'-phosphate oxidase [Alphaproteobacteria bacterium]
MADPADLRRDYRSGALDDDAVGDDPFALFALWFAEAVDSGIVEPNGMTLATADAAGRPSARVVLLKGFDRTGFRWFTNYRSRKAEELAANPHAALLFWFDKLERQVRIEGTAAAVSDEESDDYFAKRPRGSQLGAWASPQSRPIAHRDDLERFEREVAERFGDDAIPRPPHWGGFKLVPHAFEFWQGRSNRLHDRFRFTRRSSGDGEGWIRQRLAP